MSRIPSAPRSSVVYRERLYAPIGVWLGVLLMLTVFGLQLAPLTPWPFAVTIAIPVVLGVVVLTGIGLAKVEVKDGHLQAGSYRMSCADIASVEQLDRNNTRQAVGPHGDPRAKVTIRPWIGPSVKAVNVQDDPPHVLVSTRHPDKLTDALVACAKSAR